MTLPGIRNSEFRAILEATLKGKYTIIVNMKNIILKDTYVEITSSFHFDVIFIILVHGTYMGIWYLLSDNSAKYDFPI